MSARDGTLPERQAGAQDRGIGSPIRMSPERLAVNKDQPFAKIEPQGTRVPVVLDSPHSGTAYPEDFRPRVALADLRQAEDTYVDELYASGPRLGATLVSALFPRAYESTLESLPSPSRSRARDTT